MRMRRPGRKGFSMAELMAAVLFISIALFGWVSLQGRLLQSSMKLEGRQERREVVLSTMAGTLYIVQTNPELLEQSEQVAVYANDQGLVGLCRVRVREAWTDNNGQQSIAVETLSAKEEAGW